MKRSSDRIDLDSVNNELNEFKRHIDHLLYKLGDDCDNLSYDSENIDDSFIADQIRRIEDGINDVKRDIDYLSRPVIERGILMHNSSGRYELPSGIYFTTGSTVEIMYRHPRNNEREWIKTTILHNGEDYYAESLGKDVSIDGMVARIRGRES